LLLSSAIFLVTPAQPARYSVQSVLEKWAPYPLDGQTAISVLIDPVDVAVDGAGNLYVLTSTPTCVLRIGEDGIIRVIAGGGAAVPANGVRGLDASLETVENIAVDQNGILYMSDSGRSQIYRLGLDGVLTIYAGTGQSGFSGDGGPATAAAFLMPGDIALDPQGNLYVADYGNCRIRKITKATGVIQTIAGNGSSAFSGDGLPATATGMLPEYITVDGAGVVYFNSHSGRIYSIGADGIVRTIAGSGFSQAENVSALHTSFRYIQGLTAAPDGTLYVSIMYDFASPNTRVRKISPSGNVTTVAGGVGIGSTGDGGPATAAGVALPGRLATNNGAVWFIDYHVVRKVSGGTIRRVAGTHAPSAAGEGGPVAESRLRLLTAITSDAQGNYYFADRFTHSVYKSAPDLSNLTLLIGTGYPGYNGDSGTGRQFTLNTPLDVEVDSSGNVYVADLLNYRIIKMTPAGNVTTVAGNPSGDTQSYFDGMSALRFLIMPAGLRVDGAGNLYFVDSDGPVYRVTPSGALYRVFFTEPKYSLDRAIDLDAAGNVFIADGPGHVIRKVAPGGAATIIAGTGQAGFSGDGGQATAAALNTPKDIRVDATGNIFFLEAGNKRIRRITPPGVIDTVAGGGEGFQNGWEATGIQVITITDIEYEHPSSLHLEAGGRLWLNDYLRLIRMDPARLFSNWVYNCASFVNGPVAPGECVAFYGEDIGPDSLVSAAYGPDGNLARTVADTQVLVNGNPVPLIFVSKDFNSVLMPYSISGTVKLEVLRQGVRTNSIDLMVAPTMPGVFTYAGGRGQIVAVNVENQTLNGSSAAATRGQWMTIFLTGQGAVTPEVGDGVAITGNPSWPAPNTAVRIRVGGVEVPDSDIWAGLTYQGVLQVNFKIPASAPTGNVEVLVTMGAASSQSGATVNLK